MESGKDSRVHGRASEGRKDAGPFRAVRCVLAACPCCLPGCVDSDVAGAVVGGCVRIVAAGGDVVVEVRGAPRRGGTAASTAAAHERGVPRSAGGRGGGVPAARGGQGTHPRRAGAAQGPVGRHGLRACRPWDARLTRRRRTWGVRMGMQRDELRIQGVIRRLTSSTSASTTPALASQMATVRGGRSLARASPPVPADTTPPPCVCGCVF